MLDTLRTNPRSIFTVLVFGAIIITFVFSVQPESCSTASSDDWVRVGSHRVDRIEFANITRLAQARRNRDDAQSPEGRLTAATNIGMIFRLAELAEEAGLRVSDDELAAYIQGELQCNPDTRFYMKGGQMDRFFGDQEFQMRVLSGQSLTMWSEPRTCILGGEFDAESYRMMLDNYNLSSTRYESYKRRELLALNYLATLEQSIVVPAHAVRRDFDDHNTLYTLSYMSVSLADVAHLVTAPDDAAIDALLASRQADVQAYYDSHKSDYAKSGRIDFSAIVVQKDLTLYPDDTLPLVKAQQPLDRAKSAQERFDAVKDKIRNQKLSFEEVARLHNETPLEAFYTNNGRIGWTIFPANVSKERQAALKDAKPGDLIEIEEASYFSFIRVEAREEGFEKSVAEVQREIARILLETEQKAKKRDEIAKLIHERAKAAVPLQQAAEEVLQYASMVPPPPPPQPTPDPLNPAPPPDPANPTPLPDPAAPPPDPANPTPAPDPGVVQPPPAAPPLPAPPPAAAPFVPEEKRVVAKQSNPVPLRAARGSQDPNNPFGIGSSRALVWDALSLQKTGDVAPRIYEIGDTRVVAVLHSKEVGTEEAFNEQQPQITERLRRQRVLVLLGQWYGIIDLTHPLPSPNTLPYGAWLTGVYQEGSEQHIRLHPSLVEAVKKGRDENPGI